MRHVATIAMTVMALSTAAQHIDFPAYQQQRGYFDAPWLRYEAEPDRCSGTASFLEAPSSYSQAPLQAEASNCIAAQLINQGDYVAWTADADADGVTIRFSLPDTNDGKGMKGNVALYVNDQKMADIELDSYWAWQYTLKSGGNKYPDNTPSSTKFARMRFDEKCVLLPSKIPAGATFSLRKEDYNTTPYTIDFVELENVPEAVTFESLDAADKVLYEGDGSTLQYFINNNPGKTIFLPAGYYDVTRRLQINSDNTKLVGAGMWYTTINFPASSDDQRTYSNRGIESSSNGVRVEGITLSTINNKRYYNNNSNYQVGKGFMGSWGSNSVIKNVRVDHFECGAWIADYSGNSTNNLLITGCRFRNNYADGVNLCSGVGNTTVTHCSFRNNGDDDMASWSTGNMAHNNTFSYCTAENNWRASSLAFYGGSGNTATNLLIIDGMECAAHVNGVFAGPGFGDEPSTFRNISIYNCGCIRGTCGEQGDFWGNPQASLVIQGGPNYNVKNLKVLNVDIYNSRSDGVMTTCSSSRRIENLEMRDVTVYGATGYGFNYSGSTRGEGIYSDLKAFDCQSGEASTLPYTFDFVQVESGIERVDLLMPDVNVVGGWVYISDCVDSDTSICVYDMCGRLVKKTSDKQFQLPNGVYIIRFSGKWATVKIIC